MDVFDRHWMKMVGLALVVLVIAVLWPIGEVPEDSGVESSTVVSPSLLGLEPRSEVVKEPEVPFDELSEAEQHKRLDIANMQKIHAALMAHKKETGSFPSNERDLVPKYLDAASLVSPREGEGYSFEFANRVFRDGRTWEEIKEVQRTEWGDVIPILRSFNHGENADIVVNMSYGGIPYETLMNWEWDPNTLDVITELGWGPGLSAGEFTEVTVTDADGQAVENAEVWASGRHYSFDLPDRPFLTDAHGVTKIPLGVDLDRTRLGLRAKTQNGQVTPAVRFPHGDPPEKAEMTLAPAQALGGVLISEDGEALPDTWIYLQNTETAAPLGAVKTDAQGQWSAQLAAFDLERLGAIPAPPGVVAKGKPKVYVDAEMARLGQAELVHRAGRSGILLE